MKGIVKTGLPLWAAFMLLAGCGSKFLSVQPYPDLYRTRVAKVAVLPFQVRLAGGVNTYQPPVIEKDGRLPFQDYQPMPGVAGGRGVPGPGVRAKAASFLTRRLAYLVAEPLRFQVADEGEVRQALESRLDSRLLDRDAEALIEVGRLLKVDALFVGRLTRWRPRDGGAFGAALPAAAAFGVRFVRVADGAVLWEAAYNEEQKSLFEDFSTIVLFAERWGRFLTVEELAESGLERMLDDFPFDDVPGPEAEPNLAPGPKANLRPEAEGAAAP